MLPTLDDFLSSCAKWNGEHQGIRYELSWHGRSEYSPQGTWCYYLRLVEEQFFPEDWKRLRMERQDRQFMGGGSWHRHWDYDSFPDLEPHGGWTFGEMDIYLGRDGKEHESLKVGCDYAHSFDRDGGYWEGRSDVERDAKRSIDLLVEMFPRRRPRCAYSGKYDDPENFYEARNGSMIHKDQEAKLRSEKWEGWWPKEEPCAVTGV